MFPSLATLPWYALAVVLAYALTWAVTYRGES